MVFSSLTFLYFFLPLNLILYYLVKKRAYKNAVLIIMSLVFYAWGEPVWVLLLIFSSTVDYMHGRIIEQYRRQWQSKAALVSSLMINLGLLISFKYIGFINEAINSIFSISLPVHTFLLPIGISFYTFQTISYVVDVYRGEVDAQKSYWNFLMFVSLFHQLVAGPIVRYKDIAYEIENRIFNITTFSSGINRFLIGLTKKVLIANTAGELSIPFLDGPLNELTIAGSWYGIALFTLQIYFDFSGYSDMAIGLGKMFGFNYKENFNYPYISRSATEFWRRWHISLGSFFRDYLYIPLGGNKKRVILNLIIVWGLTGLWHGASWNFILWGLFYGLLIIIEKALSSLIKWKPPAVFGHLYLLIITLFGWVLFYFEDLTRCIEYLKIMCGLTGALPFGLKVEISFINNCFFLIVAIISCMPVIPYLRKHLLTERIHKHYLYIFFSVINRPLLNTAQLVIATILLVGQSYNPFLYFRF